MLKHIGRHGDRKVVVLFREVPDEGHMCLIAYSDLLPRLIHDTLMSCVESAPGQQANNLADALHRVIMSDGRNALEVLHKEGFMKKVQTSQVIMTPTAASQCRLDELNKIIAEMATGEEAVKRLANMDNAKGMQTKKSNVPLREVGDPAGRAVTNPTAALKAPENGVLSDADIAANQVTQATRMRSEARSLLHEADRLEAESIKLSPRVTKVPKAKAVPKTTPTNVTPAKQKAKKATV